MQQPPARAGGPPLVALVGLFFLSGISGLVYEVIWMRMLIRAFGVTVFAVSTILSVYMSGLAAGSFYSGRRFAGRSDLLNLYGKTEILIGVTATLSTFAMLQLPRLSPLFGASDSGFIRAACTFGLSALVLFVPTFLMGATLPMLSGYVTRGDQAVARSVGLLYGINTMGAVLGVVATGFFVIMLLGETTGVFLAAGINVAVGLLALAIVRKPSAAQDAPAAPRITPLGSSRVKLLLTLYGISGFCALSYQVIWSRMLGLVLGNSVYAFSATLGAYLLGIALGSLVMSRLGGRFKKPLFTFGVLEVAVAILAIVSLHVYVSLASTEGTIYARIWSMRDFLEIPKNALAIVFPVTLVLGALFPLAAQLTAGEEDTERAVGELYAANTVGAIVGSFITGFILVPQLGTLKTFLLVSVISYGLGVYVFRVYAKEAEAGFVRIPLLASALVFVALLSTSLEDPFLRSLRSRIPASEDIIFHTEDKAATITCTHSKTPQGKDHFDLYINAILTSSSQQDVGTLMIFMPTAFQPAPKKTLLIGLGIGEAFRSSVDASLDTTVVDLVPATRDLFEHIYKDHDKYLRHPNAKIVHNDGRNHLLATSERYDLILVDVTPPLYAQGMVNLYTREFTELARERLTPDGMLAIWFPTACFERDFWMVARNFGDTFKQTRIWADRGLTGIFLLGTQSDQPIFDTPEDVISTRLTERGAFARSSRVTGPVVRGGLLPNQAALMKHASTFPVLSDDHPYTEFPLLEFWRGEPFRTNADFVFQQK